MAILPEFGPGKPVAVKPVGQTGSKKNWIWYGVGALVGLGVILFLRRGGSTSSTQTGQGTMISTPNASEQGQITNLSDAVTSLAGQIAGLQVPPPAVIPNPLTNPVSSKPPAGAIGGFPSYAAWAADPNSNAARFTYNTEVGAAGNSGRGGGIGGAPSYEAWLATFGHDRYNSQLAAYYK